MIIILMVAATTTTSSPPIQLNESERPQQHRKLRKHRPHHVDKGRRHSPESHTDIVQEHGQRLQDGVEERRQDRFEEVVAERLEKAD